MHSTSNSPFNRNNASIACTVFLQINELFVEVAVFSFPRVLGATVGVSQYFLAMHFRSEEHMSCNRASCLLDDMFSRFDIRPACDRQTDRQCSHGDTRFKGAAEESFQVYNT